MTIFYIGYENLDYGGRSLELLKVLNTVGDVRGVVMSSGNPGFESRLKLAQPNCGLFKFISVVKKEYKKYKDSIDVFFIDTRKAALAALFLGKSIRKKIIIYDMRELRIPSEIKRITSRIGCIPEKRIIEMSNLVICANEERSVFVKQNYKVKSVTCFENIRRIDCSLMNNKNVYYEKYKSIFTRHSFKIISTSGTALTRGNDKLVQAFILIKDKPIDLLLVGGEFGEKGSERVIKDIIKKANATNIHLIDKVKSEELLYLIDNCDCGVVNYSSIDTNNKYCASGKIYEFVFAKKPVITTSNPPLKRMVEKNGIGCSGEDYFEMIKDVMQNYPKYKRNVESLSQKLSVDRNNEELASTIVTIINSVLKPANSI